eukprot:6344307-Lingulodinium_polyedra.AAC.1
MQSGWEERRSYPGNARPRRRTEITVVGEHLNHKRESLPCVNTRRPEGMEEEISTCSRSRERL